MVTIYDIAEHAGYSIATVSKALNNKKVSEKARRKIMEAVEELHYTPNSSARTLATNKSWMIGVVFGENLGIGIAHPFFSQVIEGFKKHVELYNYDLLFVSRHMGLQQETYKHLLHRGVDGIVIIQSHGEDEISQVDHMIPTVYIDRPTDEPGTVYSDNHAGSRLAVNHFVENGHTKIAHIRGNQTTFAGIERAKGFEKAMKEQGLTVRDEYLVDGGFYSQAGGREAMIRLLSLKDRPTAVYVAGDEMAIAAMKVTKEWGLRVPEDISFIGFDDIKIAQHVDPALTTIRQDKELIGQKAAIILLDKINSIDPTQEVDKKMVPVSLIKRDSVHRLA
ncbi:transcriptional regulator, LacI family [Alkalibacterium putridalgicola]|uniref:HTH-type transcriptional repressor PurR n=1 Tax=Alkalibacterium putridalgicola TaxID=426703 RepID=A0A1H7QL50_9LACT|nr:LacI family DNA-binding transcriptional regulator [Alkalibacterium putridalgicola]GEK88434.1 HTH-type transcriptional repressor PurR [Alkalibacterium putridalgicola]SEL48325.1 transcriptional regulator, LacI family [Alkalibacterium putridalgicola]